MVKLPRSSDLGKPDEVFDRAMEQIEDELDRLAQFRVSLEEEE